MNELSWEPSIYDKNRRYLIPSFDDLYSSAAKYIKKITNHIDTPHFLELGTGTGLLSEFVLSHNQKAHITLSDRSSDMLHIARLRFQQNKNIRYITGDFFDSLGGNKYNVIFSGLAIHHLTNTQKQDLFIEIYDALLPGGVFVNVEQVCSPSSIGEELYNIQHESHVLSSPIDPIEWDKGKERMLYDIPVDIFTQLSWMGKAGFENLDCLFKNWRFAVIVGGKHDC
jgi:tRNA (cmo5U34)-methyltransferase